MISAGKFQHDARLGSRGRKSSAGFGLTACELLKAKRAEVHNKEAHQRFDTLRRLETSCLLACWRHLACPNAAATFEARPSRSKCVGEKKNFPGKKSGKAKKAHHYSSSYLRREAVRSSPVK